MAVSRGPGKGPVCGQSGRSLCDQPELNKGERSSCTKISPNLLYKQRAFASASNL